MVAQVHGGKQSLLRGCDGPRGGERR